MEYLHTNPKANIISKMVNDADKGPEKLGDEVIPSREEVLDTVSLQSITGGNQQKIQRIILEAERKKQDLQRIILEAERKTFNSYFNAITALIYALEAKDKYLRGHSRRVAAIAVAIAQELGLTTQRVDKIAIAGLTHDIGKIGIREGVLNKQGKLNNEEYQHVISHCEIGERILRPITEDKEILDMVRHHHEHCDGTGYPDGLSSKQIPLAVKVSAVNDVYTHIEPNLTKEKTLSQNACILAVADAYDAMMSPRSYRGILSIEKVAEEIRRGAGTQFDPEAAEALLIISDSLISLFEEAKNDREAEERTRKEAEEAEKRAKKEAKLKVKRKAEEARITKEDEKTDKAIRDTGSEICEGNFQLVVSSAGFEQVRQFKERLKQIDSISVLWTGGSVDEGEVIAVSVQKPMTLIRILDEMPMVKKVDKKGENIVVVLKNPRCP